MQETASAEDQQNEKTDTSDETSSAMTTMSSSWQSHIPELPKPHYEQGGEELSARNSQLPPTILGMSSTYSILFTDTV
ncbi:hypothetical protein CesoFtcFv8_003812 [Champsocephalus esox]|uniref:Uncharacterized protein n=1 Tax=Champsocephalus esox TaxID=159716 RepID=A0AAN8CT89_9TELE|nr:hypothetical protein CesoFtcFv8_003812 [Champsocephalus esox]